MEILGDPYYLCTGGIGINSPEIKIPGITTNGEAPYKSGVVIISIDFRNPDDIESNPTDPNYGMVRFNKNKIPFSGCFRVNSVTSRFSDGVFTQRLRLLRLPNQSEENREVSTATVKTSITSFENINTAFA
jgi:hypothetical protein